jgi:GAF domain-containing protein
MSTPGVAIGPRSDEPADRWRERLAALSRSALLDTEPDRQFERVTAMVSRLLRVPISVVSLVELERQFFQAGVGLAGRRETPLTHSFCQYVVASDAPLQVDDARTEPLLRDNLAATDLGVIAYLGFPLHAAGNVPVGSLCAIDSKPRRWQSDDLAVLKDLAAIVEAQIALRAQLRDRALPALHAAIDTVADEIAGPVAPLRTLVAARAADRALSPDVRADFGHLAHALDRQAARLAALRADVAATST